MFNYSWQKVLLWGSFIFFLGAALLRQETAINQDLGRHLRLGEMIVAGGPPARFAGASARRVGVANEARKCALYSNCLTYTYPDYPFVNHHWGSEVIFYSIYRLGGFGGLILFKTLILGAAFVIMVLHASKFNKGPAFGDQRPGLIKLASAIGITFFSIQMVADRLTTRPEIFGYLLFSLLFWILDKKDLSNWRNLPNLMLIPIIMILWVNLHISFVFGLILVWIWTGSRLLASLRGSVSDRGNPGDRHAPLRQGFAGLAMTAGVPAISTLITIFNPAGLRGALMPLSIMKDYGYTIVENMTPFFLRAFKPQPEYWIYAGLTAAAVILALVTGKLGKFAGLVLLVFSIFPLIAVRHLAFFALTVTPVLTPLAAVKFRKLHDDEKFAKLPLLAAGGLFLAAVTNPVPLAYAKLPTVGLAADRRHEEAVKFVKDHDLQGKMWNNYDIGSYLEWFLPEHPTFVDGRPEAFPAGFFQETYIPMQESRQKWDEVVERYDIQWVFAALTDATPWFQKWRAMIQKNEDWKLVYIDKSTAILVNKDGTNQNIEPVKNSILEIYAY